ncbi:MAG TPA: NAD(P)/FAD-dependent oxidoreductase [Pseudonocardia sp.]|jgi:protoporphyrinogen oxidase
MARIPVPASGKWLSGRSTSAKPLSRHEGRAPSAVVVGAGLSGLTAAYRLRQDGWRVVVLESEPVPGGRVRSTRSAGYLFDLGATSVGAGYAAYLELAGELGLEMVPSPPCLGIVRGGVVHEMRIDRLARSGLATRLLSWPAKLKFGRLALDIAQAKLRGRLSYADLGKAAPIDTETVHEYARRALNAELAEYVCAPLTRTMIIVNPDRTSKVELFSGMANALGGGWQVPAGGAAAIIDALVERLDVRLGHAVQRVSETDHGVEVTYTEPGGRPNSTIAEACVVACPLPAAVAICPDRRDVLAPLHAALPYTRTICVTIGTTRQPDCPAFLVMLPPSESPEIALFFQDHRKDPARAPHGHGLFTLYFELTAAEERFTAADDQVVEIALRTLCRLWPELAGSVDFSHVHRWAQALPHTQVGTYQKIAEFTAALDPDSRVQFAADYMSATGQNTAVALGGRAAANLRR